MAFDSSSDSGERARLEALARLSACSGKGAFPTYALAAARQSRKYKLDVYRCGFCGFWHRGNGGREVGTNRQPYRRSRDKFEIVEVFEE